MEGEAIVEQLTAGPDGAGWYYFDAEYPDEGVCGPFNTRQEAEEHARSGGYEVATKGTEH